MREEKQPYQDETFDSGLYWRLVKIAIVGSLVLPGSRVRADGAFRAGVQLLQPSSACVNSPPASLQENCQAELARIRETADKIQADNGHPALADYRICQDFLSCFSKDCKATPENTKSYSELKAASRPFVMFNHSGKPAKGTVVLAHGLGSSPYSTGAIAEELSKKGYNVVSLLLPNHGADHNVGPSAGPSAENGAGQGQTKGVSESDYRRVFANGITLAKRLFGSCNLSVGGMSTGGALAIDYLQTHPAEQGCFDNLLLFDPALALTKKFMGVNVDVENALYEQKGFTYAAGTAVEAVLASDDNTHPSWHGLKPSTEAKALGRIIYSIRQSPNPIDIPTVAYFSNGGDDHNRAIKIEVVDTAASREALFGKDNRGGGLISASRRQSYQFNSVSHRQLAIRDDLYRCSRYPLPGDDPYFDQIASSMNNFMANGAPGGTVSSNQRRSVQAQN